MCQKNIAKVPTVTSVTHFREKENTILRMATSSLFVIGHVIEGEKEIFTGENTVNISQGETYLLSIGNHYSKNLISPNSRFEELMITITHDDIMKFLILFYQIRVIINIFSKVNSFIGYLLNIGINIIRSPDKCCRCIPDESVCV